MIAAEMVRAGVARDPLQSIHFASEQGRELVRQVAKGLEVYLRSGLRASKTTTGATLGVALARGLSHLDGRTINEVKAGAEPWALELPRVRTPNLGILIVPSYKQAQDSSVAIYRKLLGDHPHHLVRQGPWITEIRVKPDGSRSNNPNDWSKIVLYPRDGEFPRGQEVAWVHGDEVPSEDMWRQARARIGAGRQLYMWITATPEYAEEWAWLRADYDTPADWRAEIVMSVYDNQALTRREVKKLEEKYKNDPLGDARLNGEYVNLKGSNPFRHQHHHLQEMEKLTTDPRWEEDVRIRAEMRTYRGMDVQDAFGTVFIWEQPQKGERYYIPADPSLGVADGDHDPLGLHVYAEGIRGPKRLVARYNGFIGSYGLGWLAASLGERYNDAMVDFDNTGGYGGPMATALGNYKSEDHPHGYPHIAHDIDPTKDGEWQIKHGFTLTPWSKAELIECIRWALIHRTVIIPSLATIKCLMNATMDQAGKLEKPPGVHYEDLICLGRFCFRHFQTNHIPETPRRPAHDSRDIGPRNRLPRQPFASMPWARS